MIEERDRILGRIVLGGAGEHAWVRPAAPLSRVAVLAALDTTHVGRSGLPLPPRSCRLAPDKTSIGAPVFLNRIDIENVRAIRRLSLDFRGPDDVRRWTVLLGENGCGKTTVLKSIAMVLAGSDALAELLEDVDEWIHNKADVARIHAEVSTASGERHTLSLELRRGDRRDSIIKRNQRGLAPLDAAIGKADRNYFIAGYGAFRRPADDKRSRHVGPGLGRAANIGTLFSASRDLVSFEQWAMDLDYRTGKRGREVIRDALKSLLPGMEFKGIDKRGRSILMSTVDGDVPLRNLSEGYQAMAAWAGDILFRMTETFRDRAHPTEARGVLLIDEMDLHLHPVWKRNFVDYLDKAFPKLQIVATTHSPLSVQQCGEGELFVVKREGHSSPTLIPFRGDPSKLRLSELFLSPLIGLDTLDSPRVATLRQEARAIELRPDHKSASELARLREIARELEGTTPLPASEAPALAPAMAVQKALQAFLSVTPQEHGLKLPAVATSATAKRDVAKRRVGQQSKAATKKASVHKAAAPKPAPKTAIAKTMAKKTVARTTAKKALSKKK